MQGETRANGTVAAAQTRENSMETQTRTSNTIHPVMWGAGIALIVFSAVGVSAFMGWIPGTMGGTAEKPAIDAKAANTGTPARANASPVRHPPAAQTPEPVRAASNTPAAPAVRCSECGVVESVREIDAKGSGTGLGAVGGAVVGGLLGNQVGAGRGQDAMTVVGAVGGALAGNEVEKRVRTTRSYGITVRFEDGSSREISEAKAGAWRAGDKVKLINGALQSNA